MIENFLKNRILTCLPFVANEGQNELITRLGVFLCSHEHRPCFVLRGYAGTGKSSVVGALVQALSQLQQPCVLLAPTGRAAKVLARYANAPAFTIHKCIYRRETKGDAFQLGWNRCRNTLFIVDEASMISADRDNNVFGSGSLLDDLIQYVFSGEGNRLLLIGDDAQLPPIGHEHSVALDTEYLQGYGLYLYSGYLTEVARQAADSGILNNATRIRCLQYNHHTEPIQAAPDVHLLDGQQMVEAIDRSFRTVGEEETIILTRSNRRTNLYNQGVRSQLLSREGILTGGDRVMISRNNYFWTEQYEDMPFLANGDILEVTRLRNEREMYGFHFADAELRSIDYTWEIQATVWLDSLTTDSPEVSYRLQRELFDLIAQDYPEIKNRRELRDKIMASPYYNALQIRYAYAVTCHKAQGGQWKHVFIDRNGLPEGAEPIQDIDRWLYTAITRATEQLYILK